jgi:hypothetical protein
VHAHVGLGRMSGDRSNCAFTRVSKTTEIIE